MIVLALVLLFLSALAWLTAYGYILPVAAHVAAVTQPSSTVDKTRHAVGAYSRLLLALLLLILGIGALLTYRIIRFVRPRRTPVRTKTTVIDAWAEAGRRGEATGEQDPGSG
jgi:hypothetical protein